MARFAVKNVLVVLTLSLCLFVSQGAARPSQDDGDDDAYINDDNNYPDTDDYGDSENSKEDETYTGPPPVINNSPLNLTVKPGATVWLPCDAENADSFATMWMAGREFLWTEQIKMTKDLRFHKFPNNTIRIVNVRDSDSGNYTCEISSEPTVKLVHQLHVPTPPEIIDMMPKPDYGNIKKMKKGDSLMLECKVTGYPKPEVEWIRKNKRLPSGEISKIGTSIMIESVNRHHDGTYQCTASNGLGKAVQRAVEIHVQYAPEIAIEKETVNTAEGYESELICTVHAEPKAMVEWLHNGIPVTPSTHAAINKESGGKHILQLTNTKKEDFGSYVCRATNSLGTNEKVAKLSGLPNRPMFVAETPANDEMSEIFEWTVESSSPITEYKLEFRKTEHKTEWILVESPIVENPEGNKYTVKHKFSLPAGMYETRLRAKNTYGWSDPSHLHSFSIDNMNDADAPKMTGANTGTAEPSSSAAEDIRPRIFAVVAILSLTALFL